VSTVEAPRERVLAPPGVLTAPRGLHRGRAPAWWGMVFLILTEATFFSILLTSYWFIRFQHGPVWPPDGIDKPKLFLVSVMTPILLVSSGPMHWAELGIKRGRLWQLKLGLVLTFAMGATFLALQGVEYHHILTREFTPRTDAYGTLFFSITGFHGIHVAVGLLMNLWLQYYSWRGSFSAERYLPVQNVVMYWHFVDAVWVFILGTLYLSPHFWP
jgi:heme/copper-type cytochrome/quinol oxidase subunit 3